MKSRTIGLVRDVLDKLMVDRNHDPLGRVDGIILVIRGDNSPPRLAQLEAGIPTLTRRLSPGLSRALHRFSIRCGIHWKRPVRVDWKRVDSVGKELKLNLSAAHSPLLRRERWLRDHVIRKVPGGGFKKATA